MGKRSDRSEGNLDAGIRGCQRIGDARLRRPVRYLRLLPDNQEGERGFLAKHHDEGFFRDDFGRVENHRASVDYQEHYKLSPYMHTELRQPES